MNFGINPNTIQKAYGELEHKNMISCVMGKGNFINKNINDLIEKRKKELLAKIKENVEELKLLGVDINEIITKL